VPESGEVWTCPCSRTAANFVPSADDATAFQLLKGELFVTQVIPEFVEVHIREPPAATSFMPSADDAMVTDLSGAALEVQVTPEFVVM